MSESYVNGYRFGVAYASNYGNAALLRFTRTRVEPHRCNDAGCACDGRNYNAGIIDAALAVVQGVK
jgi:hypothetical protein